jgi:putative phosphoribosyl transferase
VRKLGVPGHEELALGAVASGGVHIVDQETIDALGLSLSEMHHVLAGARQELERYERLYRRGRPPLELKGKTTILVDDGVATGSSMRAAIAALRKVEVDRIVVGVPVAPSATRRRLHNEADDVVCLHTSDSFYAVGAFYEDFSQVTDEEVSELLRDAA